MTQGMLVVAGGQRFMLPLLSIEKIIEPKALYSVEGQTLITLNSRSWPVISLAAVLRLPPDTEMVSKLAVVLRVAEQRIVFLVDDILTQQELAVKPVSKLLKSVPNIAGVALLGNGEPIVVLNAADLIRSARSIPQNTIRSNGTMKPHNAENTNGKNRAKVKDDVELTKTNILVVDDSITTRTLEKNILQAAGFSVTTATDGEGALRQLRERAFDLVVSDVQMPNMDGIALTRHLRESKDYSQLPIILVTSLESREDREQGLLAGANAYILKRGFDQADLLSTIRQLI
jgi:two-component system chemotaxis sensor kinase CheA